MSARMKRMSTMARVIRVWWNVLFVFGLSKIRIAPY